MRPRRAVGSNMLSRSPSVVHRDRIVAEVHMAVGLRPQADAARYGLCKRVLEIKLAVEIAFNLRSSDANLKIVPLLCGSRRIPHPFDRGPLALFELPQHEVVFQTIGSKGQVVAVWLEVEQDARALIDAAGQS